MLLIVDVNIKKYASIVLFHNLETCHKVYTVELESTHTHTPIHTRTHTHTNYGNEDQCHDDGSDDQDASGKQGRKEVNVIVDGHAGNDDHHKGNAGHINRCRYTLGVVQSLHFNLAGAKCKEDCCNLEDCFVSKDNSQPNIPGLRVTQVCVILYPVAKNLLEKECNKRDQAQQEKIKTNKQRHYTLI